ncbi:MAG: GatB/YqeY domain-containing protein [Pseudomonadota bacterium]
MRNRISDSLKEAMKEKKTRRVSTLRLINAAINDRDIALRGKGKDKADDEEILDILTKMVKQREESSRMYREAGRQELEAQEMEEMEIIREFLPKQLSPEEAEAAVADVISETGAESLRDMGKVMGLLKERYRGQLDMGVVGPLVKARLGA